MIRGYELTTQAFLASLLGWGGAVLGSGMVFFFQKGSTKVDILVCLGNGDGE